MKHQTLLGQATIPSGDRVLRLYQGKDDCTIVSDLLRGAKQRYDVIALDVDNGPEALSSSGNNWLYSPEGINCARKRLNPHGVLAYWSATPDPRFAKRLRDCGLRVSEKSVFAHGNKGTKHTIWLATV